MLLRRIIGILCVPVALFTLISEISFISKDKQKKIETNLETDIAKPFKPVFRFAITSDVHITAANNTNAERLKKMFETAYRYSDSHPTYNSLDAVLLAGDNCDRGSDAEYEILKAAVKESIREGTEFVTIMGNHEFAETGHEGYVRHMGEELDKHVVIKGFHFIGLSPDPTDTWHTPLQINWLSRELRKAEQADPEKPIFTMQHGHIWNTVYVSRSWYTQMSIPLHMVYSQYPQVINFSGHSHGPVNNPLEIWQNNYTQLGTGTLNYFEMERDIGSNTVPEGSGNAAQYLIVEVDAQNRVRIQPYNIKTEDFFKTPSNTDSQDKQLIYQINDVFDTANYAYTSARKKTASTPEFDKGAALQIKTDGQNASVSFPQAKDDVCVYGYRISLYDKASPRKAVAVEEIYSGYYFEPMPETLTYTFENLEKGKEYTVEVTPMNVWLAQGEPIISSFEF